MHKEIQQDMPGICPKCGMKLVEAEMNMENKSHHMHSMRPISEMSFWEKSKMSISSIIVATNAVLLKRAEKDLLRV